MPAPGRFCLGPAAPPRSRPRSGCPLSAARLGERGPPRPAAAQSAAILASFLKAAPRPLAAAGHPPPLDLTAPRGRRWRRRPLLGDAIKLPRRLRSRGPGYSWVRRKSTLPRHDRPHGASRTLPIPRVVAALKKGSLLVEVNTNSQCSKHYKIKKNTSLPLYRTHEHSVTSEQLAELRKKRPFHELL